MSTYTEQEGMRKTNFCPESNPGLMTSKPTHQTLSHNHQTKVCPLIPSYNCSVHCPTGNLTLQATQIMCRQNPVRNRPVTPSHQGRSHCGWIYDRSVINPPNMVPTLYTVGMRKTNFCPESQTEVCLSHPLLTALVCVC